MTTWMHSQQVATTLEPRGKSSSIFFCLDEVDVESMSCPQQLLVLYNLSIITKNILVILVLYDTYISYKHSH